MAQCNVDGCRRKRVNGTVFCSAHEDLDGSLSADEFGQYSLLESRLRADTLAARILDYEIRDLRRDLDIKVVQKVNEKRALAHAIVANKKAYENLISGASKLRGIKEMGIDPDTGEVSDLGGIAS